MSGSIKATPEEIQATAGKLAAARQQLSDTQDQARAHVASLTTGSWVSQASGAFENLYQQFDAAAKKQLQIMDEIGAHLTKTGQVYADTDEQLARSFQA